jgi:hypothetical protein
MATDLYRRAFARAAQIIGGRESLAKYLRVDLQRISEWSARGARPPVRVLLSLAEVLKQQCLSTYRQASSASGKLRARPRNVSNSLRRALPKASFTRRKAHR